jgi:hypothetical protein
MGVRVQLEWRKVWRQSGWRGILAGQLYHTSALDSEPLPKNESAAYSSCALNITASSSHYAPLHNSKPGNPRDTQCMPSPIDNPQHTTSHD